MDKQPLPTVSFDPQLHVIECRERKEGRTVLVTLESLSAAEQQYEVQQPTAPAIDDAALSEKLTELERRIVATVASSIPPQQHQLDVQGILADLTSAIVQAKTKEIEFAQMVTSLASRVMALEQFSRDTSEQFAILKTLNVPKNSGQGEGMGNVAEGRV